MPAAPSGGGGGASAGDVRAGGAYYEIVGRDTVTQTMDKIRAHAQQFVRDMKGIFKQLSDEEEKPKASGGLAGLLTKGGALVAGIGALAKVGAVIQDLWVNTAKWEQELGRAAFQANEAARAFDRVVATRDEWTAIMSGPNKAGALEFDAAQAERSAKAALAVAERQREVLEKLGSYGLSNFGAAIAGDLRKDQATAQAELSRAEAEASKMLERAASKRKELERAIDPNTNPAFRAAVDSLNAEMKRSGEEPLEGFRAKVAELEREFGSVFTAAQLADLKFQAAFVDAEKRTQAATRALREFVDAQRAAREDADLNPTEKELARFRRSGADPDAVAAAGRELLGGGGVGMMLRQFLAIGPQIAQIAKAAQVDVKGGFSTASARQQFGYGDTLRAPLDRLVKLTESSPEKIGAAVADNLKVK